jgi:hypothetical protein
MSSFLIAVGDLHGHYQALDRILNALHERYGVFQDVRSDRLRRGVRLVVTGDYIDRGRHALRIIERLQRLDHQNPGQIVTLLGNHELMALEGYDDAVGLLRGSGARGMRGMVAAYSRLTNHGHNGGTEFIREFGATSLPAFESYVERMARTGDIGHWMRGLLPSHKSRVAGHGVLFMHADLPEKYRDRDVLESHLRWIDEHMKASTLALGGSRAKWANLRLAQIFWGRTFADIASAGPRDLAALCRKVGVDFIVTGHTPHESITAYGKRIFDIDVGMCRDNLPQALVFSRDGIVGFGADGTERRFVRFGSSGGR